MSGMAFLVTIKMMLMVVIHLLRLGLMDGIPYDQIANNTGFREYQTLIIILFLVHQQL